MAFVDVRGVRLRSHTGAPVRLSLVPLLLLVAAACGAATNESTSSNVGNDAGSSGNAPIGAEDSSTAPLPDAGDAATNTSFVACGGKDSGTPRCKLHEPCAGDGDCAEGRCLGTNAKRCQLAPSCTGAAGTRSCGLAGTEEDCCRSLPVPGGTFDRLMNSASTPQSTHVSAFGLDMYEITVGRLRAYFEAVGGNPKGHPPAPGAGLHPRIPNSGWRSSFDVRLPASWTEINERLTANGCAVGGNNDDGGAATWTAQPGPFEALPITCIDWYTLFAFCAWDGGRLPTDAEWLYAAQGGDEQRWYAWGPMPATTAPTWPKDNALVAAQLRDPTDNVYKFTVGDPWQQVDPLTGKVIDGPAHMTPPGRKTGYGRWGHADLTGNVLEYLLDNTPIPEAPCATDCAKVDWPDPPQDQVGWYPANWWTGPETSPAYPDGFRALRGGSFDATHPLYAWFQYSYKIAVTYSAAGGRCARD
jgi:sulfatase modifying factor 1